VLGRWLICVGLDGLPLVPHMGLFFVFPLRVKVLDSLNQILQKSPGTRIFVNEDHTFRLKLRNVFLRE